MKHIYIVLCCLLIILKVSAQSGTDCENSAPLLFELHTNPVCLSNPDGSIELVIIGDEPFAFNWYTSDGSGIIEDIQDQSNLSEGTYDAQVTDVNGCTSIITIELVQEADTIPPAFDGADDIVIDLLAGECGTIVDFSLPTVSDNCSVSSVLQVDDTDMSSGSFFSAGTTALLFEATDGTNSTVCTLNVIVNEYVPPFLICGQVNMSLNENCEVYIDPLIALSGNAYGCLDNYEITLWDVLGQPVENPVNESYIGQTISVGILNPYDSATCTASVTIFDSQAPVIECQDEILSCGYTENDAVPELTGYPVYDDQCGEVELFYDDVLVNLDCNSGEFSNIYAAYIERTWRAIDLSGNVSEPCLQTIYFKKSSLKDVLFPLYMNDQAGQLPSLECGSLTDPASTGMPLFQGVPLSDGNGGLFCNLTVTYEDQAVEGCGGSYGIIRKWTVIDECTQEANDRNQIILIKDGIPPQISLIDSLTVTTNSFNCTADVELPVPEISDNCSAWELSIQSPVGTLDSFSLSGIPLGEHMITYRVQDECSNEGIKQLKVKVIDGSTPTAICKGSFTVSIPFNGELELYASTFDQGSKDNCSEVSMEVRRLYDPCLGGADTLFGPTIKICCEDVNKIVDVQLKVTDSEGNYNICSGEVAVYDNQKPSIFSPPDITVECNFEYEDLNIFGKIVLDPDLREAVIINGEEYGLDGYAADNCGVTAEELPASNYINSCGIGTIVRKFKATDIVGKIKYAFQTITFENTQPFYINLDDPLDETDGVVWPVDTFVVDCNSSVLPENTGEVEIVGNNCDLVSFNYHDEILAGETASYYQIWRTWTVTNLCHLTPYVEGEGYWTNVQIITVSSTDAISPVFEPFEQYREICLTEQQCDDFNVNFDMQAIDNCTASDQLSWAYEIDIFNDGDVNMIGEGNSFTAGLPAGSHKVSWVVADLQDNTIKTHQNVLIKDCEAPEIQCWGNDQLYLDENGYAILTPFLLKTSASDNCTSDEDLDYLIAFHPENIDTMLFPPPEAALYLEFYCPDSTYLIDYWVQDQAGNWNYCSTPINIIDRENACSPAAKFKLSGMIQTEYGVPVENAKIQMIGDENFSTFTDISGNFSLDSITEGTSAIVLPEKSGNPLNGVTTYDLILIKKHILGISQLDSPYKLIAADANNSGSISTQDMLVLRKLILNIDTALSANTSWRFIDADYIFSNPMNPFQDFWPEYKSFDVIDADMDVYFIGMKIGDVNGTAIPNELLGADDRAYGEEAALRISDKTIKKDEVLSVPLYVDDLERLLGFQFSLQFERAGLEFLSLTPGNLLGLSDKNFNLNSVDQGVINCSWENPIRTERDNSLLCTLSFKAGANGKLSDWIRLISSPTPPESYLQTTPQDVVSVGGITLNFEKKNTEPDSKLHLYQNLPNPFHSETVLPFYLPYEGEASIQIYSTKGQLVYSKTSFFLPGQHELVLTKRDLKSSGLYYVTLTTAQETALKKILMK
ncbi:MAG: T9SS type A sorting domain-containing protein [Bacteroidetes bacterium]|nr:T9SS type A sorting domain-containing protein [Bacteroidota bacterium]